MIDILGNIEFLIEEIIVIGIIACLGWLINHFRNKAKDVGKLRKQISLLDVASFNQDKAILVIAKLIDEQSKRAHPNEHTELLGITKEILKRANMSNNNK